MLLLGLCLLVLMRTTTLLLNIKYSNDVHTSTRTELLPSPLIVPFQPLLSELRTLRPALESSFHRTSVALRVAARKKNIDTHHTATSFTNESGGRGTADGTREGGIR